MYQKFRFPSVKAAVSTAASVAATAVLVRSFASDFVPHELRHYLLSKFQNFLSTFANDITLTIDEVDGLKRNHLFEVAELYISTIKSPATARLQASLAENEKKINVTVGGNEEIADQFAGINLKWRLVVRKTEPRRVHYHDEFNSRVRSDVRYIELVFHKKHKAKVLEEYLPHVLEVSMAVKEGRKTLKLHTLRNDGMMGERISPWQSVNLNHPANFESLAMDDDMKQMIIDDLDRFVKRKELYRKLGKAWKRGYLLYGPPGTGKSSLIAAMANYLNFDVYDLELTDIHHNSNLRKLLISTGNRSILVVEDIDAASIDLSERNAAEAPPPPSGHPFHTPKITLSGLLNFIDGLWSSCGDERIIVFTTNHKEKLDSALLRPGRMDVHIHMSYCTPRGLNMLVKNYLGVVEDPLVLEAERMVASAKVTPAEIGEQLLKSDNPRVALRGLIKFLEQKKEENLQELDKKNIAATKEDVEAPVDIEN
ncbi:protein HYPER-SENSITIVITY-RELATED 4-like [Andrographis paniculata]|uniref:protein HYPER-SENSITIVITY-RELATED 4-like n=1 Tax=Andrographis paniculata TaxID=175694 RepID=UPI0021E7E14B|nr:protein HYPER-SENSITIVITY-RELATED 4-like [Andrographis paniculata]